MYNQTKKLFLLCTLFAFGANLPQVVAQNTFNSLLTAGTADANALMGAYTAPISKGFGYSMNHGWYSTAKTHKTLGFDINVILSASQVRSDDELIDINSLGLRNTTLVPGTGVNGTDNLIPSAVGPEVSPKLRFNGAYENPDGSFESTQFDFSAPPGAGFKFIPMPMVQVG